MKATWSYMANSPGKVRRYSQSFQKLFKRFVEGQKPKASSVVPVNLALENKLHKSDNIAHT